MSKRKTPFSKDQVVGIIKRIIQPSSYQARRDTMMFYRVFERFPDAPFWLAYKPDFLPDSMIYYLSDHGKDALKTAIAIFNLDIPTSQPYNMETTKVGEDIQVKKPKSSISSLFK